MLRKRAGKGHLASDEGHLPVPTQSGAARAALAATRAAVWCTRRSGAAAPLMRQQHVGHERRHSLHSIAAMRR